MRRTWEIGPYVGENGELYPPSDEERDRELLGAAFAAQTFGGSLLVVPKRVRYPNDTFATVGWIFKYDSGNVPAVDAEPEQDKPAVPEPEGELTVEEIADHFPEGDPTPEPALAE